MAGPAGGVRFIIEPVVPGQPADFVARAGGVLLEVVIWMVFRIATLLPIIVLGGLLSAVGAGLLSGLLVFVVTLLPLAATIWLEAVPQGQTYGKHVLRIAVVDARTSETGIGFLRSVGRRLAMIVSALPLGLGFLWSLWDPERRTWHDLLTGTRVVRVSQERILDPVAFVRAAARSSHGAPAAAPPSRPAALTPEAPAVDDVEPAPGS